MSSPTYQFDSLLRRARKGDQEALSELVLRYESQIRIVASARLGRAMRHGIDSLDVVQSVHRSLLGGLLQNRFTFSSPAQLTALAVTMVHRKIAHKWRKMKNEAVPTSSPDSNLDQLVSGCEDEPSARVSAHELLADVLANLNEKERTVIEMRISGWRTVDIAERLGVDPDVLRVQLSRLRRRLRKNGLLDDWI